MKVFLELFLGMIGLSGAIGVVIYAGRKKKTPQAVTFEGEEETRMALVLQRAREDDEIHK